jgi:hypothetical protein
VQDTIIQLLRRTLLVAICLVLAADFAAADDKSVGTEGIYYLRATGPEIEVKPFEPGAPLLLRIADVARENDMSIYEIRYIGYYPGNYDLRDHLRYLDGTELTSSPAAPVSIISVLPQDHNGELGTIAHSPLPFAWPYRILLAFGAVLWLTPLLLWIKRRLTRRPALVSEGHGPHLSLADQLRPLVEAALAGRSSPRDQAALERLLLSYWRTRLKLNSCEHQQALASMRSHPEAGKLLRQVDAWLHLPPGRREIDVPSLLAPYRNVASVSAIEASDIAE